MEFIKVCEEVNKKLDSMSLVDTVLLFKNTFNYPIDYKDDKFYYSGFEWEEVRMSDFIKINRHWMNIHEFDRLYDIFLKQAKNA